MVKLCNESLAPGHVFFLALFPLLVIQQTSSDPEARANHNTEHILRLSDSVSVSSVDSGEVLSFNALSSWIYVAYIYICCPIFNFLKSTGKFRHFPNDTNLRSLLFDGVDAVDLKYIFTATVVADALCENWASYIYLYFRLCMAYSYRWIVQLKMFSRTRTSKQWQWQPMSPMPRMHYRWVLLD